MPIQVLRIAAVLGVLAVSGFGAPALASPHTQLPLRARPAQAGSLQVHLKVSDHHPRQFVGVLFNAVASRGDGAAYFFDYGDGVTESSYQPLAMHGYRHAGTFRARVGVIERGGQAAASARVTITVRDGVPPVVRIDSPQPDQRLRLKTNGALFKGQASDANGVRKVELAIELVASARHFNRHGECIWYDGNRSLVLTPCSRPFFFAAHFAGGHWRFRIPARAAIPPGTYVVRVAATDHAGNVSHFFTIALRTILPVKLAL